MRPRGLPAIMAAAILAAGCGDGTGPGDAMTAEEEASLIAALTSPGLIAAAGPLTFGSVLAQAGELGETGGHTAIAYQMRLTFTGALEAEAVSTGLIAWTGLNSGTNTIATALNAGVVQGPGAFPLALQEAIGPGAGTGLHYIHASSTIYLAQTGTYSMTTASFGEMADCPSFPAPVTGFAIVSCRFASGSMEGSFAFEATRLEGTGADAFSQPVTAYDLPAVQLELVIDVEGTTDLQAALGQPTAP